MFIVAIKNLSSLRSTSNTQNAILVVELASLIPLRKIKDSILVLEVGNTEIYLLP